MIYYEKIYNIISYLNFIYYYQNYINQKGLLIKSIIYFLLIIFFNSTYNTSKKYKEIKIALCTMGKNENLYVKEFIDYYINLGIDNIFIYDDNDKYSEKISDIIDIRQKKYIKIFENIKNKIFNQSDAFTDCYQKNNKVFDWILMLDMDEYLYIEKDTLKNYLLKPIFNKCDFIKFHWVHPTDNNQIHYENKSLFERFKKPYKRSPFIKSIIRGNISNLKYWVHSPYKSPLRNITCNNVGKIIKYRNINFESNPKINIKKAYIIHFNYKSTEEYINKIKRGYSNWFGNKYNNFINSKIKDYFRDNIITKDKINYFERELNLNLNIYKILYF